MMVKRTLIQGHTEQKALILAQCKETQYFWQFNSSRAAFIAEVFIFKTCVLSMGVLRKLIGTIVYILPRSVSDLRDAWVKYVPNIVWGVGRRHRDGPISLHNMPRVDRDSPQLREDSGTCFLGHHGDRFYFEQHLSTVLCCMQCFHKSSGCSSEPL